MSRLTLPLKWHGGKYYLAPKIVGLMPPHLHYVEPYCGGCAVLLARDPDDKRLWVGDTGSTRGVSELVNDINGDLTNFWTVLQNPETFAAFHRIVEATPLSRLEWEAAGKALASDHPGDTFDTYGGVNIVRAAWFFVRCRQSLAGRMKSFTSPTRARVRRGMNGNVSEWLGAVDGLPAIHARLRRVFVEGGDGIALMKREDTKDTLFYCDPPYLHETRSSPDVYEHEMTAEQHRAFLAAAKSCRGKVMISGYESDLYDRALSGWTRHTFDLPNNAAGGGEKQRMTEVLWCNF
jgi:DNA adenine methylase